MNIHLHYVKELKNGSYDAFEKLYDLYADLLYAFALGITKSPSEAKDILQEVFMRVWNTRAEIQLDLSFKAYLYKIARNLIVDSFRRKMTNISFEAYICSDAYQDNVQNNIEQELYLDEFIEKLEQAKELLTPRQREIFELSREQGLSITAISNQLEISEQTVKNQLSIALKALRLKLSTYTLFLTIFL